ncbi:MULTISPECIES: phage regulatory CII family protein [Vibrio]|uniref:Phage regulatory CII family protein n=1 Tax=Vibrio kanaloae TaxID=170673 RepID=A0ABV4LEI1_9VIBR|nr:phage regulatory CII family protein [Vibrio kanaloae]MCG9557916.1 phage regulatory CII family protein [Vibrio kanaloae]OEF15628.1 transcriptional regulator [Vibrio kanaloae 5S-149]QPK06526.1 phage regulatory CII family protein [Vibrio kanaloae]
MNEIDSMCEFRGSKQKAFNEACCAFANSENMTKLAKAVDMNATMLRNKLNPEQPHILTNVELVMITKASGNFTILNSLLLGLGVVTAQIPNDASEETFIKRALENAMHSGDLSRMALEHAGNDRLTRSHKQKIIRKAQSGISNLVQLIADVENRTTGVTPFLSMGIDFIANGAPIPGLS